MVEGLVSVGITQPARTREEGRPNDQGIPAERPHLPTRRITSATNEAINGVIKALIKRSYGFRSFPNFRTAVLFHRGKLQLYPTAA